MLSEIESSKAVKQEPFAFFDFDDTLLKHDSMGYLLLYYLKKHPLSVWRIFLLLVLFLLYLFKFVSFQKVKEALIFPLSKMTDQQIQLFYQEELIKRYYPNVLEVLKKHAEQGVHVWLVSASPEAYLNYTDLPVEKVIGTRILRKDGHWTNQMISKNCKGEEKVVRIEEILQEMNLMIDYENSYSYSDSDSDWPMLCLTAHRFRVHKKNGRITPFKKSA